jgi:5S rRNA maturation endonuclease (ribonuclease M5)
MEILLLGNTVTTVLSWIPSIVVAFVLFVSAHFVIGFIRELGSTSANHLTSRNNQSMPQVYIEGEDFDIDITEQGNTVVSTNEPERTDEIEKSKKIIVEGQSDRRILQALINYFCNYSDNKTMYPCDASIIAAKGVENIPNLMKWAQTTDGSYWAVVDNDIAGERIFNQLSEIDDVNPNRVFVLDELSYEKPVTSLIDLFSEDFLEDCSESADVNREERTSITDHALLNEIVSRLHENQNVKLEDVRKFRPLLWEIRAG